MSVEPAPAAQVAVEVTALDQVGQHELLVVRRGRPAAQALKRGDRCREAAREDGPPRRIAGARVLLVEPPYTTHSGARPCSEPIGRAVVAVLGVVVILYDQRTLPPSPCL